MAAHRLDTHLNFRLSSEDKELIAEAARSRKMKPQMYVRQKIIEAARVAIYNEKKAAISEIKDQVAILSLKVAEKLIREKFSDSANQNEYIDKLIKETKLN